jgi:haloalkane dehalogenase
MMRTAPLSKSSLRVGGRRMAFHERGEGDAIVFLHGNPTSSYLWRNVIPRVADHGRCIAPDLIGMGDSEKVDDSGPDSYTFLDHRRYLDGLFDQLDVGDRVTFVLHDWGSALGFDWARRHADRVAGLAYLEAIVVTIDLDDWGEPAASFFRALRSEEGEKMILERNLFVEAAVPAGVMRTLTDEEMAEYRRPFVTPGEDRRPTLSWPRQLPVDGEPADVVAILEDYATWLSQVDVPKLFINGDPGYIMTPKARDFCRSFPQQTEVSVPGLHYLQEDSPDLIGEALSKWMTSLQG